MLNVNMCGVYSLSELILFMLFLFLIYLDKIAQYFNTSNFRFL